MKKILLSIGSVTALAAPIAAVVSCTSWDHKKVLLIESAQQGGNHTGNQQTTNFPSGSVDLTSKSMDVWHPLFKGSGRTHPTTGKCLYVIIGDKKYGFIWSDADSNHQTVTDYEAYTKGQDDIINYLAARISAANNGVVTAAQVKNAFAISTPGQHHFTSIVAPVNGVPTDGGVSEDA